MQREVRVSYHQLSDNLFIEVFLANVDAHSDQIAAINMLLLDTPLTFFDSLYTLPLQPTSFAFGPGLAAFVGRVGTRAGTGGAYAQQGADIISTGSISYPGARTVAVV